MSESVSAVPPTQWRRIRAFAAKWLFPVLVIVEIVLVQRHVLDGRQAIVIAGAVEAATVALGAGKMIQAAWRFRQGKIAGLNGWAAMTEALTIFLPRPLARAIALEPRIWVCLARWAFRRIPRGPDIFGYTRDSGMAFVLAVLICSAPIELLLGDLLLPWHWLRLPLALIEVYSILWIFGFAASLSALPHRLHTHALELHYGILLEGMIPYEAIASVQLEKTNAPQSRSGYQIDASHETLWLVNGGTAQVTLHLRAPVALEGILRPTPPVTTLHLALDDPARFVAAIKERIEA